MSIYGNSLFITEESNNISSKRKNILKEALSITKSNLESAISKKGWKNKKTGYGIYKLNTIMGIMSEEERKKWGKYADNPLVQEEYEKTKKKYNNFLNGNINKINIAGAGMEDVTDPEILGKTKYDYWNNTSELYNAIEKSKGNGWKIEGNRSSKSAIFELVIK